LNTGVGISEIIVIFTLILVFFGSKEIPQFIRMAAKFLARIRYYTDQVKREIDTITQPLTLPQENNIPVDRKADLRKKFITLRKELSEENRNEYSSIIYQHLKTSSAFTNASSVMIYVNMGSEVVTKNAISDMLNQGKRVLVPYCKEPGGELGITEIQDVGKDLHIGMYGVSEVLPDLRKHFFKSDLQLIICPGVAFDVYGGRLGRGKSYYDRFLKDLKGRVPIVGLAFNCQLSQDPFPFEYHDVSMDLIITEKGMQTINNSVFKDIAFPAVPTPDPIV
jgi:5-formyltetrahydrofolate cyclo-ligase